MGVRGVKTKNKTYSFPEEKNNFPACGCKAAATVICVSFRVQSNCGIKLSVKSKGYISINIKTFMQ
jgi:hypothetical protein